MPMMALQEERARIAHLLRRFGLGASELELDFYGRQGLAGAIDLLLNFERVEDEPEWDIRLFLQGDPPRLQMGGVSALWHLRLASTRKPLQEKMTLFWHDHFATSAAKVVSAPMMLRHVETLRSGCVGRFDDLLLRVSQDPAMLFWLDNHLNVRGKPNENFAREIMELFTLGIGHYSEEDVREVARAFTGWTFIRGRPTGDAPVPNPQFVARPRLHDDGEKTILGKTGKWNGQDVIKMLCDHPQTALHLTRKLWEWFAYADPEPALVERLASRFRASGLDVKALLRTIMEAPEFYSEKAVRAIYKNPIDFTLPPLRQLGLGEAMASALKSGEAGRTPMRMLGPLIQSSRSMGMQLLFPPDVDGWPTGAAWITSATMIERIKFAEHLFRSGGLPLRLHAHALLSPDPTPEGIVQRLVEALDAPIPHQKLPALQEAARSAMGPRLLPRNAPEVAIAVTKLIFGSPEYQFA
jgi:hypothetical protein